MSAIPLADAKNRLSEVVQSAQDTHERTIITKNGRPAAILLAIEDFEALEETVEWLADPTTLSDIHEAHTGPSVSLEQVRAELQQRRP
ncbi:MAG TPA: type II toxin-antitoxin system Phd/YefM family antitoxin [Actinomycetales bacterium]|nr:type II toxin-antitoxin system Phd/YefM family antitoxin [Actinomycetales bacterium]